MAAPIYQSTQTTAWANAASVVVTKPSGLAVGDLMIARHSVESGNYGSFGVFTSLGDQLTGSSVLGTRIGYKIADSADVAASNFTFTNGASAQCCGSITRITGGNSLAANYKYGEAAASNTSTPSVAAGVTPTDNGNSTLLLLFATANANVPSVSTYAIATSNPSWTEVYDIVYPTDVGLASMAYATRPEVTATGNVSCAGGDATTDWAIQLVSIPANWQATIADSVTTSEPTVKQNIASVNAESVITTETVTNPTSHPWTNTSKNSTTWTNTSKT